MSEENKMQEMYTEYQLLSQQLKQLQENLQTLESHTLELVKLKENLGNVNNVKVGEETLIGFGSGIFLKGALTDNKTTIMNVGANIFLEKTIEEAAVTVDKQIQEINEIAVNISQEGEKAGFRMREIEIEFEKLKPEEMK